MQDIHLKNIYQKSKLIQCYGQGNTKYEVTLEITAYWNIELPLIYITVISNLTGEYNLKEVHYLPGLKQQHELIDEAIELFRQKLDSIVKEQLNNL